MVPTLLLDLVLILLSGSDLVFSEVLDPSVLALSLVLDLALVVGLILAPALILELVLVLSVFGLRLALVLLWVLALARGSQLFQDLVVVSWLSHDLAALAFRWWIPARRVQVLVVWGWLFGLGLSLLPYTCVLIWILWPWWTGLGTLTGVFL